MERPDTGSNKTPHLPVITRIFQANSFPRAGVAKMTHTKVRLHGLSAAIALIFSLCAPHFLRADEAAWPKLDGGSKDRICTDALAIARATYDSDNAYLYAPPTIPKDIGSMLVLQPKATDISEGDALIADPGAFRKNPQTDTDGDASPSLYWQVKPDHGMRFVIYEEPFGWRGEQYALFALTSDVAADKFLAGYKREPKTDVFKPLAGEGWRPPLVLQEKATGDLWSIDVGAPYIFLSDWNIYSIGSDGAARRCSIHFHPQAKSELDLLPSPVRKLATLLDGTLGKGENEGTLAPTAGLRIDVMHIWGNVAMRPWAAVKSEPHNSRQEVDAGLKAWSHQAKSFGKLYREIMAQYPRAEHALAKFYRVEYRKSAGEADAMARQALDMAFRTYFTFSG